MRRLFLDLLILLCHLGCPLWGMASSTPEGLRAIETILSGDRVWGYDLRAGAWRSCMVSYHSAISYDDLVVTVRANGEAVRSTYHHPYWVVAGEELDQRPVPDQLDAQLMVVEGVPGRWVDAGFLQPGDQLFSRSGGTATVEAVETDHTQTTVYHIYVEDLHNYAVGNGEWLVHNAHKLKSAIDDNIDATNQLRRLHPNDPDVLENALVRGNPSGSYVHKFESGVEYVGKGLPSRARRSASEVARRTGDRFVSTQWESAIDETQGLIDEARKIALRGGIGNLHNQINSPGLNLPGLP